MVTEPRTAPSAGTFHKTAPVEASRAHTEPVRSSVLVPSTTSRWPLPLRSANAGLPPVVPSRVLLHTWLHCVSKTLTVSSSLPE